MKIEEKFVEMTYRDVYFIVEGNEEEVTTRIEILKKSIDNFWDNKDKWIHKLIKR